MSSPEDASMSPVCPTLLGMCAPSSCYWHWITLSNGGLWDLQWLICSPWHDLTVIDAPASCSYSQAEVILLAQCDDDRNAAVAACLSLCPASLPQCLPTHTSSTISSHNFYIFILCRSQIHFYITAALAVTHNVIMLPFLAWNKDTTNPLQGWKIRFLSKSYSMG